MNDVSKNTQMIYDLDKLMQPFDFITDPIDGIRQVEIISITLESLVGDNLVIIECPPNDKRSILIKAQEVLKTNDPLEDSFILVRVILLFSFFSDNISPDKTLLVTITKPDKLTMSNETTYNLVNKYLHRWNLEKKTLTQFILLPRDYLN